SGTIMSTAGVALQGGVVWATENPNWYDDADSSGRYQFSVHHGSYTLRCSSATYFDQVGSVLSVNEGDSLTQNFTLTKRSVGTVYGNPWITDHLVISKVVGSTTASTGFNTEYVELFNPTTTSWL